MDVKHPLPLFLFTAAHRAGAKRWTACQSLQGTSLMFIFISKLLSERKVRKQRWAFCRSALEGAPPRCSAAVYDNVCMFTALIVISVLTGASRHITLALPLGRPLKIPADSALKIFAFIYSVGVSEFEILVFFSAVFISSQKRTLKNRFLYVFVPQTNSLRYKSAIRGKILKKKKKFNNSGKITFIYSRSLLFSWNIYWSSWAVSKSLILEKIAINLLTEIRPLLEIRVQKLSCS